MPRGSDVSTEEWQFLCDCFGRGLDSPAVTEEYQETEFPIRDRRTLSKWRIRYEVARRVILNGEERAADPIMVEARNKHFGELTHVAEGMFRDLTSTPEELEAAFGATCVVHYRVMEGGRLEVSLPMEEDVVGFQALQAHTANEIELWGTFDRFKDAMLDQVRSVLRKPSKAVAWGYSRLDDEAHHYLAWDQEEPNRLSFNGHIRVQAPQPWEDLVQCVQLLLRKQIVGGQCPLCPSVAPVSEGDG